MAKHLGCDPLTVAMKVKSQAWNCENLEPVSPVRRVSGSSNVTELEGELTVPISDYSDLSAVVPRQHSTTNDIIAGNLYLFSESTHDVAVEKYFKCQLQNCKVCYIFVH